ncbi:MAG: ABC transporter permease [Ardenticatenaceae bacterium]|nr:ABC transporter permease [Ardenticatenaceae bacterium]HBY98238.1 ABC transporter permease [Chloroflexota bacterium]
MNWRQLLIGFAMVLVIWQLLAIVIARSILPPPATVLATLAAELTLGELRRHFLVSAWRVVASIALALATAVPAGLVLGQSPALDRFFQPLIYITYPIPKIVFLPIVLIFLGIGDASKIAIIWLILFFQVLVVVRDEAATLRPELIASVRSLGAGRMALFRFVYLPATIPAVLTALRLSIGTAVAVLFFAESFATTSGLGYYIIVESFSRVAYAQMYAGVVALSLLGLSLYFLANWLERRLAPWLFLS